MSASSGALHERTVEDDFEQYRAALTGRCTRMLGSRSEAEDAVQETLLRAWRNHARFQGRCQLGSWLYRIANNVCLDMLTARSKRAEPVDPASLESAPLEGAADADPAEQTLTDEAFRLALVLALERLPARQRAVLMLREVFGWRASEVGELLGITVAAVNSLLQRARASLEPGAPDAQNPSPATVSGSRQELLASFLSALEPYETDLFGASASPAISRAPRPCVAS
jgi:RNA polymerase sigma-70 factor (ECF subfamily)